MDTLSFAIGRVSVTSDQGKYHAKHIDHPFTMSGSYSDIKGELLAMDDIVQIAMDTYHGNQVSTLYHDLVSFYWKHDCTVSVSRMISIVKTFYALEIIGF